MSLWTPPGGNRLDPDEWNRSWARVEGTFSADEIARWRRYVDTLDPVGPDEPHWYRARPPPGDCPWLISCYTNVSIMSSDDHRTLTTEAEISAYLHRSRMAILDVLRDGAATATQIAVRLGVHPANLTRHIRVLEKAGLVALVEKRDTGRNLEKYYAATADSFIVAPDTAHLTAPHKIALTFARSELSAALARLPDESAGPIVALALGVRISPGSATTFAEELARLGERFAAADENDGEAYQLVLCLYPGDVATIDQRQSIQLRTTEDSAR